MHVFGISAVICTHNPRRDYLGRVLEALKAQTLPKEQWELLLIDNASKEPQASAWDLDWHEHARTIREDEPGLTPARLRGIRESTGNLLLFVDDDNVLAPGYLAAALSVGAAHQQLGVWGGDCIAEFETKPSPFLVKYLNRLAISTTSRPRWSNSYDDFESIPPGAGMVFRRVVAEEYHNVVMDSKLRKLLGLPTATTLYRCDDTDIAWTAIDLGLGVGRFPELQLTHLIPRQRVDPKYILKVIEGDATSRVLLDHVRKQKTFSTKISNSFLRALWLRFRLSAFDYKAWQATGAGIRRGLAHVKRLQEQTAV